MINSIDIDNFGPFGNFNWSEQLRDADGTVTTFRKLNILYGRNYSGKTTLSRIVRSLETGKIPNNYESPAFAIDTSSGRIDENGIDTHSLCVRVYNKDFVDQHLGFLRNDQGQIAAFALLGDDNRETQEAIADERMKLGSVEEQKGLSFELHSKEENARQKDEQVKKAGTALQRQLTHKATRAGDGIKHNPIYNLPNYNRPKIEADLKTVCESKTPMLPENEAANLKSIVTEQRLSDIATLPEFPSRYDALTAAATPLLAKSILPTAAIQELLDAPELQQWVRQGIQHHRDKRDTCGFCGEALSTQIWERLDGHFSEASTQLDSAINKLLQQIDDEKTRLSSLDGVNESQCYQDLKERVDAANSQLEKQKAAYVVLLDELRDHLKTRKEDIFVALDVSLRADAREIVATIDVINKLIVEHNERSQSLTELQSDAKEKLRLNEIAQFAKDIQYVEELGKIDKLKKEASECLDEVSNTKQQVALITDSIKQLEVKITDEKKGAERVNDFLNRHFGHRQLRLDAVPDETAAQFEFKVMRGAEPAFNLSEGECSLIAFCYFMAKLEDIDSNGPQPIIFIDDPICSLDNNHVFFIFSLIEGCLAQPRRDEDGTVIRGADGNPSHVYSQLFISTHNLEFLKYLKRLKRPGRNTQHFLVQQKGTMSEVSLMPNYLREYVTEFNFLFSQIVVCSDPGNQDSDHHSFYNFGNNLRKFMEVYLFFRYPHSQNATTDHNSRIERFFADSYGEDALVQRVMNELSHLAGQFDRGMAPIDYSEIAKMAAFVLTKLKKRDQEQYVDLLSSIDAQDPLPEDGETLPEV